MAGWTTLLSISLSWLERLAETLTCCESQVAVLWCPQVLPGWELTPHKIPFWAGGAIPSMLCSDTSQEWITSPRGAFPGSSKSLSTTTKPIMLLWCWIQCSSLLFIFSLMEKGSLFGWEGNKLLDEYKQLSQIHYKGEILTVHVFLVAKPQWIYIYYSMQAVLICRVVINCKNRGMKRCHELNAKTTRWLNTSWIYGAQVGERDKKKNRSIQTDM